MRTPKVVLAALIVIALAAVTWYALMGHERVEDTRQVTVVAQRLNTPWPIVFYGDTGLVSSRDTGEVLEVQPGGAVRVAGVVEGATHRGEGGLLGLAVGEDSRLYAYHTTAADNRIIRFTLESGSDGVKLGEPEVVIEGLPSASIHNGGRIDFGPDGMLYVAVGDAGDAASAQDITKLSGKILRMTPDGGVPDDNPFADSLVYSYGHRNVQGLAWTDEGTM